MNRATQQCNAIAAADAYTNDAGLPTYTELVSALRIIAMWDISTGSGSYRATNMAECANEVLAKLDTATPWNVRVHPLGHGYCLSKLVDGQRQHRLAPMGTIECWPTREAAEAALAQVQA